MTGNTYLKIFISEFSTECTETSLRFVNLAAVILSCFSTPYHSADLKVITVLFLNPCCLNRQRMFKCQRKNQEAYSEAPLIDYKTTRYTFRQDYSLKSKCASNHIPNYTANSEDHNFKRKGADKHLQTTP